MFAAKAGIFSTTSCLKQHSA